VFAVILILIGVGGFVLQATEGQIDAGGVIVLLIGLGLLGAFAYTRLYGYLIPGGILTGLGAGIALQETFVVSGSAAGGVIVLGLGLGFLSIWLIGLIVEVPQHHWWPLIPGGILTGVGAVLLIGEQADWLLDYWYLGIIAVGVLVLALAVLQPRQRA
jgi:hypothetical protein